MFKRQNDLKNLPKNRWPLANPSPTDDIGLDRIDHLWQFEEAQRHCRLFRKWKPFIKCSNCTVIIRFVKARNCYKYYYTAKQKEIWQNEHKIRYSIGNTDYIL